MFNYINSWKSRKKPQWNIEVRLGRLTLLQLNLKNNTFRFRGGGGKGALIRQHL